MEKLKSQESEFINTEKSALVLIDLQNGIASRERSTSPYTSEEVIQNASRLVKAFSDKGAFIVLVRVSTIDGKDMVRPKTDSKATGMKYPKGWDNLVPEIADTKNAHIITKRQWGSILWY